MSRNNSVCVGIRGRAGYFGKKNQQRKWNLISYLAHQPLTQPVGPRSARPCPGHQWTLARGRHMSSEHWSRARSDLHTVAHVRHDARDKKRCHSDKQIFVALKKQCFIIYETTIRTARLSIRTSWSTKQKTLFLNFFSNTYRYWIFEKLHKTKIITAGQ